MVSTINGYMRTPKHETLLRYGTFINNYLSGSKLIIEILPLDYSPISSNS